MNSIVIGNVRLNPACIVGVVENNANGQVGCTVHCQGNHVFKFNMGAAEFEAKVDESWGPFVGESSELKSSYPHDQSDTMISDHHQQIIDENTHLKDELATKQAKIAELEAHIEQLTVPKS